MFRSVIASAADWHQALDDCIAALVPPAGDETLGILYVTEALADQLPEIAARLRQATDINDWAGAVGLGVGGDGEAHFGEPAIAVMTMNVPAGEFAVMPRMTGEAAREFAAPLNDMSLTGPVFALLHADASNPGIDDIIQDVATETGGFLVGGLTMSGRQDHHVANGLTGGGLSGVLFSPSVGIATSLSQGCTPVAGYHEVTECQDNIIVSLDGDRAYDILAKDVGEELIAEPQNLAGYIHAALPVAGSDTGDYLVRNLIGLDPEQGLVAIGEMVEPGDQVMFVRRDEEAAAEDLTDMVMRLKARAGVDIKGAHYVSCIARGPNTFDGPDAEMSLIAEALGDVPLVGFYANGEISNNRLYAYTGVLTLFI